MRIDFQLGQLRSVVAGCGLALAIATSIPAEAQTAPDVRIRKLEGEVRALQRKVFPGGDASTFEPEITRAPTTTAALGQPATSAVTDLLTRMDAVEGQLARLTAQIEQNTNRIGLIEARVGPAPAATGPATTETVNPGPSGDAVMSSPPAVLTPPPAAATSTNLDAMRGRKPAAASVAVPAQRLAQVQAVEKPQTGDPADDDYTYGYRLWDAKLYPEAEQQLKLFLQTYPTHPRAGYGRNLLGRAYLDGGNPREAAKWFLQNYQADKAGPRASDSLLFLARSMKQLGDTKRACIALAEFGSSYAGDAATRLKADYESTRAGLTCS